MASFLRGKQAGMQKDLSANILQGLFAPNDRARFGINSQISCIAYDPVQSLLAVGTNESKFGSGQIYVFGQTRVQKSCIPSRASSFRELRFCANRLVSLDAQSNVAIWDIDSGLRINGYHAPGVVTSFVVDPMLDWCFLGLHSGEVLAYDLDRERMSPFRLPNFWLERDPKARAVGLVSLQLHPRDIGQLLIAYTHGFVIYSFKQNQPIKFFEYTVPPGAPGGNGIGFDSMRKPKVVQALWHPSGTFILTAHDDGSLVFWDAKDGRVVMARTLSDLDVDKPVPHTGKASPKHPYVKLSWCCKENPEDTGLLVAGGLPLDVPVGGLSFLELGITPIYATASWQILSDYCKGKRQNMLETPLGADVTNFFLVPRASPHFAGAQDPIAIFTLLSSGELLTMSFPSGYPISPTNQLHPSLTFVHPFATWIAVSTLDRTRWLGMVESRGQGEPLLTGGALAPHKKRRFEGRSIVQVAHADSTIRIWDVGHGDEIENPTMLQVDLARALDRYEDINVTAMHLASNTGEFAVGTSGGEVVLYRWGGNSNLGGTKKQQLDPNPGGLTDISIRSEPTLKNGLQPFYMYEMMQGPITALRVSDVGFVAVGSETGFISLIDLRGPHVMFQASMADFAKQERRSSFLRGGSSSSSSDKEWPVTIEFGVLTLEGDSYSSIACFVGTNHGKVVTLKLLPSASGYDAKVAGVAYLDDRVVSICPIEADTGKPATATGHAVAGLRTGQQVNGVLVVVTRKEARIFRPATAKGASKAFDDCLCDAAIVTEFDLHGFALVGVFGDRTTRAFSLPGLKELGNAPLRMMDGSRGENSAITEDGEVFVWTGPSELAVLQVWGTGQELENSADTLINPELLTPPRPAISNLAWISGTQYVSPTDLDLLVGGSDRPPSKRMLAAAAAEKQRIRAGTASPTSGIQNSQEGWGDYLTRQLNERTERLNIVNDSLDSAADASQKWAEDVSKFVDRQKRSLFMGALTSKFS